MIKIAPSILASDFANLEREIQSVSSADYLHVDVMDGCFVPNISVGLPVVAAIRRVTTLPLDVHLMIREPIRYVERFIQAGADLLTIHLEADTPAQTAAALKAIRAAGRRASLCLKPGTPAEAALPYLPLCDMILVMTVEPGFGGQAFMAEQLDMIRRLSEAVRAAQLRCDIEVDGGIDITTAQLVTRAGASVLVAGSAVFHTGNRAAAIAALRESGRLGVFGNGQNA